MSPYRSAPPHVDRCPRCAIDLERSDARLADPLTCGVCPRCGGVWLAGLDETRLREGARRWVNEAVPLDVAAVPTARGATEARVDCPTCLRPTRRVWMEVAGVEVDICDADGVWFDASELRALWQALNPDGEPTVGGAIGVVLEILFIPFELFQGN